MKKYVLALGVLALFVVGCSSTQSSMPTKEIATETLTPELAEGKTMYENNCAKCHKLFDRSKLSKEEWVPVLNSMAKKAKIDDVTKAKIYAYLVH